MNFFELFFQILATFKKGYLNVSKKFQTKAKRSLTWPLYGLFGLENTLITNDEEKKLFIPNFSQIRLVVPKLWTKQEIACLYDLSQHCVKGSNLEATALLLHLMQEDEIILFGVSALTTLFLCYKTKNPEVCLASVVVQ